MTQKVSTLEKIYNWLARGRSLSTLQARSNFNIWNVSARIAELRDAGHTIVTVRRKRDGVQVYRLARAEVAAAAKRK